MRMFIEYLRVVKSCITAYCGLYTLTQECAFVCNHTRRRQLCYSHRIATFLSSDAIDMQFMKTCPRTSFSHLVSLRAQ